MKQNDSFLWFIKEMVGKVKLIGKTLHGKNRVHQHGDIWEVLCCQNGQFGPLGLQSLNKTFGGFTDCHKEKDWRWVLPENDLNFEVINMKEL